MVMLERMLPNGAEQVSVYAASYRLIDAGNMIAFLFAGILFPKFSRMLHFKDNINNLFQIAFSFLMVFAFSFTIFGYFFSDEIITTLYVKNIYESSDTLKWLSIAFSALAGIHIYGTLLTANGQLRTLNYIAFFSILVNIILNLILIPTYKAEACAISSMAALMFSALLQAYFSKKYIKLEYSKGFGFKFISYLVLLIAFTYGYRYHEHNLHLFTHMAVFLFFSIALALLSGFISPLQVFRFLIDEVKSEVKKTM
jgi:O-antigen/teichoic acid export membrane protein